MKKLLYLFLCSTLCLSAEEEKNESTDLMSNFESIFPKFIVDRVKEMLKYDWKNHFSKSGSKAIQYVYDSCDDFKQLGSFTGTTLFIDFDDVESVNSFSEWQKSKQFSDYLVVSKNNSYSLFYPGAPQLFLVNQKFAKNVNENKKGLMVLCSEALKTTALKDQIVQVNKLVDKDVKWTAIVDQPSTKEFNMGYSYTLNEELTNIPKQKAHKEYGDCGVLSFYLHKDQKIKKYLFTYFIQEIFKSPSCVFTYRELLELIKECFESVGIDAEPMITSTRPIDLDSQFIKKEIVFR